MPYICGVKVSLLILIFVAIIGQRGYTQQLLITEFMADPNPPVGLPDAEYIELYNAGETAFDLNTLTVAVGGKSVTPGTTTEPLLPNTYILLVRKRDTTAFSASGIRLLPFALPALTNGGDKLCLLAEGEELMTIEYTPDWYNDQQRDAGGYSLEYTGSGQLDCAGSWRASLDPLGGTPGRRNSVFGMPSDTLAPTVEDVTVGEDGVTLSFSEAVLGEAKFLFLLDGQTLAGTRTGALRFQLDFAVDVGRQYELTVLPDFTDCAGNAPAEALTIPILLPGPIAAGDVLINEVLFNPSDAGEDYVELYNKSAQTLSLRGWRLTNNRNSTAPKTINRNFLLPPGELVAITADATALSPFAGVDYERVIEADLPSLPNTAGNISLISPRGTLIDALDYEEAMHNDLLSSVAGVSLERISHRAGTQVPSNWASAASEAGYGTPTRANSQARPNGSEGLRFELGSEAFSPDGDGVEDVLEVLYFTDRPGLLGRLTIFDGEGRQVRELERVALLAGEGKMQWDGVTTDGQLARRGAYVLLIEVFDPNGHTERYKLVAVLAA